MVEDDARRTPVGVGILGAGPVTQAIHLPTLARLGDDFVVRSVMDVDAALAASVASRVGAAASTSVAETLADDRVEVVVVCSPHAFHAGQVVAACRAGKRAILCEKPFAFDAEQAAEIVAVSRETGVPIVVGAMHTFDDGWLAGVEAWGDRAVTGIRSSIALPPNPSFEDLATQVTGRPTGAPRPATAAESLWGGVLGLAIHDLPLVRQLLPRGAQPEVVGARVLEPGGYLILLEAAGIPIEVHAVTSKNWQSDWVLEATAADAVLRVDFTPSYVQAGSATAELVTEHGVQRFGPFERSGYESEWRAVADIVHGTAPAPALRTLIDDLAFALEIADGAIARMLDPGGPGAGSLAAGAEAASAAPAAAAPPGDADRAMTALTVRAEPSAQAVLAPILASLPATFAVQNGSALGLGADVIAVDGAPGWAERASRAIDDGARGVFVTRPCAESRAAIAALRTRAGGIPVVLDTRWRHNPAVTRAAERYAALDGGASLLEARAVVASPREVDDAMRDLALLAQAVAGPADQPTWVRHWPARSVAHGHAGSIDVHLTVEVTSVGAGAARVRALGGNGGVDLWVPDADTARAARLNTTDPAGCLLEPTRYESARRAALRRLAAAVRGDVAVSDLDELLRVTAD